MLVRLCARICAGGPAALRGRGVLGADMSVGWLLQATITSVLAVNASMNYTIPVDHNILPGGTRPASVRLFVVGDFSMCAY
jgi:hypothetical protein